MTFKNKLNNIRFTPNYNTYFLNTTLKLKYFNNFKEVINFIDLIFILK